ncbi:MAG: hypothetical protein U5J83_13830 [Bryobacterales bacterium]|nr:hypothetical protein [Bryobacterales bacterium]
MQVSNQSRVFHCFAMLALLAVLFPGGARAQKTGFEYTLDSSVRVGAFEVRKVRDLSSSRWHVEILREGSVLFRSSNGAKTSDDLLLASFPLLGGEQKQIVIEEYTGDLFCCTYNYVLRAGASLDVLYSSTQYPVGFGLIPEDLNGDGVYELITTLTRFDNFFNLPHEASPATRVVFRYDAKAGRYVVANREFSSVLVEDAEKEKATVEELRAERKAGTPAVGEWRSRYTGAVLNVALGYIYAGKQQDGWIYLIGKYDLDDREVLVANLRYYLMRCPIFRSVYTDANETLRTGVRTNE